MSCGATQQRTQKLATHGGVHLSSKHLQVGSRATGWNYVPLSPPKSKKIKCNNKNIIKEKTKLDPPSLVKDGHLLWHKNY